MKKVFTVLILVGPVVLLNGCAKEQTNSHIAAQEAVETIRVMYETLPAECKTKTTDLLVRIAQNKASKCDEECVKEKAEINKDKIKWKVSFWALIGVICAYILRKILK